MQIKLGLVCTIFCLMWLKAEGGSIAPRSRRSPKDTHEWLQALINEFSNLIVDVHIGKRVDDPQPGPATPAGEDDVDKPPREWLNDMLENFGIYMNETILDDDEDIPDEPIVTGRMSKDAEKVGEAIDWVAEKWFEFLDLFNQGKIQLDGVHKDEVKAKVKREVKGAGEKEPKGQVKETVKKEGKKDAVKEEPKEEVKEEPKKEVMEDPKKEVMEEPKKEVKEDPKEEVKEEPKEEVKEEPKEEVKEEPKEEPEDEQDHWVEWLEKTVNEGIKKFQDILGK